jgi:hypothetical protein
MDSDSSSAIDSVGEGPVAHRGRKIVSEAKVKVRLLFVDDGSYHHEVVEIPSACADGYDRLIDCVREDPAVLKRLYVDVGRLCAAYLAEDD